MVLAEIFERFLEESPVCVMQRAVMENVLAPTKLDAIFHSAAVAQYERELLFSTLVDLMSLVVCRISPSVHAAYVRVRDRCRSKRCTTSSRMSKFRLRAPLCNIQRAKGGV